MIHVLLAVFDTKAEAFAQPYFSATENIGIRAFAAACQDKDSLLNKFPSDYSLYRIGTFDDASGLLVSEPRPVFVASAVQLSAVVVDPVSDPAVAQRLS